MGRKKTSSHELEQYSRGRLETVLSEWILNSRNEDYGFDYEVRITRPDLEEGISPSNFFIQLKASESFESEDSVFWDLDVDYLVDDCTTARLPVVLALYSRKTDRFYWRVLQDWCWHHLDKHRDDWRDQQSVRIHIDRNKKLSDWTGLLHYAVDRTQQEIGFRHSVRTLDSGMKGGPMDSELASNEEVREHKERLLREADRLNEEGLTQQAIEVYKRVYESPTSDEETVKAIAGLADILPVNSLENAGYKEQVMEDGLDFLESESIDSFNEGLCSKLQGQKRISERELLSRLVGAEFHHNGAEQNLLILRTTGLHPPDSERSLYLAEFQWDDGDFWDDPAKSIARSDEYELVAENEGYEPLKEACSEKEHSFSKTESGTLSFCEDCELSKYSVAEALGQTSPYVCRECGKIKYEMDTNLLCPQCG